MSETTFQGLIEDLERYLTYQRDEGLVRLEVERAVLDELARDPQPETANSTKVEAAPIPDRFESLEAMAAHLASCRNCPLCTGRNRVVPGEGNGNKPDLMFIGEEPGAEEDAQGRPYVGKAGQLLTKMIEAMGYSREEVYITNVVKCRPPNNRKPEPEELKSCLPYLLQQINLVQPKFIVGLGATAMEGLLGRKISITRSRGVWQETHGIKLMPTYHPAYLLRDASKKKEVWGDLKEVLKALDREPPAR